MEGKTKLEGNIKRMRVEQEDLQQVNINLRDQVNAFYHSFTKVNYS